MVWLFILLTDVIVKVADVKSHILADPIAIFVWVDVIAHILADAIAIFVWMMLLLTM